MAKKLERIHGLIWLAFLVYTFNLFVPDYKHTHHYATNGVDQYIYGNHDFQLKFILFITAAIPMLVMTFVKHTTFSKIASLVFSVAMIGLIYWKGFATSEDGYFSYTRDDFAGYAPHAGYYVLCTSALLFFIAAVLKSTVPVAKKLMVSNEVIDDYL